MRGSEIEIPEPCHADWALMDPQQRGWFCRACDKRVHDVSNMSEVEARGLLQGDDDICVAFDTDAAGDIMFAPPLVPASRLIRSRSGKSAPVLGLAFALVACTPHGASDPSQVEATDTPVVATPLVIPSRPTRHVDQEPAQVEPVVAEPCETPSGATDVRHVRGRRRLPDPVAQPKRRKTRGKPIRGKVEHVI